MPTPCGNIKYSSDHFRDLEVNRGNAFEVLCELDDDYEDKTVSDLLLSIIDRISEDRTARLAAKNWSERTAVDTRTDDKVDGLIRQLAELFATGSKLQRSEAIVAYVEARIYQRKFPVGHTLLDTGISRDTPDTRAWAKLISYKEIYEHVAGNVESDYQIRTRLSSGKLPRPLWEFAESGPRGIRRAACRLYLLAEVEDDDVLRYWNDRLRSDLAISARDFYLEEANEIGQLRSGGKQGEHREVR